jgi:protein-disulfide isomerase
MPSASTSRATTARVPPAGHVLLMLLLAAVGFVIACIQTKQHLTLHMFQATGRSSCSLSAYLDCDAVYGSRYSEMLGLPVSTWGASAFLVVFVLLAFALWLGGELRRVGVAVVFRLLLLMVAASLVFLGISMGVLHVLCPLCTVVHASNVLLLVLAWLALRRPFAPIAAPDTVALPRAAFLAAFGILALALVGVGAWGSLATYISMLTTPVDVPREVAAFLARKPVELKNLDKIPMKGRPDAPITIVEFGDLECEVCRGTYFLYESIIKEYGDKVRWGFKHYPLDQKCNQTIGSTLHPHACVAAKAAVFAHQQGRFWEFLDAVYSGPKPPDWDALKLAGRKVGLDESAFTRFMSIPETGGDVIVGDIQEARSVGVTVSTPVLFFNGRRVEGGTIPVLVRAYIDALLDQLHSK